MKGCLQCGNVRGRTIPKTHSKRARTALAAQLAADPYCSAACCRKAHRVDQEPDHPEMSPGPDLEWTTS